MGNMASMTVSNHVGGEYLKSAIELMNCSLLHYCLCRTQSPVSGIKTDLHGCSWASWAIVR